jgi:hypothetical protein
MRHLNYNFYLKTFIMVLLLHNEDRIGIIFPIPPAKELITLEITYKANIKRLKKRWKEDGSPARDLIINERYCIDFLGFSFYLLWPKHGAKEDGNLEMARSVDEIKAPTKVYSPVKEPETEQRRKGDTSQIPPKNKLGLSPLQLSKA